MNLPTDRQVFLHQVKVSRDQIDDLNHVNNVVYVEWVQAAASAHWVAAAPESLRKECIWVVMRHEIDYQSPALEGDELSLYTWVDEAKGATQHRHVSIQRSHDGKEIAYAKTTWCLLDPTSGRPKRISAEIERRIRLEE